MTLTLYRSRWLVYYGRYAAVDAYEWSFERIEPTRTVRPADEHSLRCVTVREPDGDVAVKTPPFAKLVELGESRVVRLAFHGEEGIDAGSVVSLTAKGERGFSISEGDAMAKKVEQPGLFGDDSVDPVGAYGPRRPPREDRVTPVAEELKAYQEARLDEKAIAAGLVVVIEKKPGMQSIGEKLIAEKQAKIDAGIEAAMAAGLIDRPVPKKKPGDHSWLKAELYEPCSICGGTQTIPPETRACVDPPDAIAKAERRPDGSIVCPFCDRGFIKTGLTVGQVERWRAVIDEAEALARERGLDPSTTAKRPTSPKQLAIDAAGVDLVADVDAAIAQIVDGSGIVAIRILRKVREVLAKGGASE